MASRTPSPSQARTSTQTASSTQAWETAPFLAWCSLPDDLTLRETHQGPTATGGADEPQRGATGGLPLEPGVCHHAQRRPGGGIGGVAEASQSLSGDRTGQLCQRDSSRLCRCSRSLLLTLE